VHQEHFASVSRAALEESAISGCIRNADRRALLECDLSRQSVHLRFLAKSLLSICSADSSGDVNAVACCEVRNAFTD
jgi:hypothetical protein